MLWDWILALGESFGALSSLLIRSAFLAGADESLFADAVVAGLCLSDETIGVGMAVVIVVSTGVFVVCEWAVDLSVANPVSRNAERGFVKLCLADVANVGEVSIVSGECGECVAAFLLEVVRFVGSIEAMRSAVSDEGARETFPDGLGAASVALEVLRTAANVLVGSICAVRYAVLSLQEMDAAAVVAFEGRAHLHSVAGRARRPALRHAQRLTPASSTTYFPLSSFYQSCYQRSHLQSGS